MKTAQRYWPEADTNDGHLEARLDASPAGKPSKSQPSQRLNVILTELESAR